MAYTLQDLNKALDSNNYESAYKMATESGYSGSDLAQYWSDYTGGDYNYGLQQVNAYEQTNNLTSAANSWQSYTPSSPATSPTPTPAPISAFNEPVYSPPVAKKTLVAAPSYNINDLNSALSSNDYVTAYNIATQSGYSGADLARYYSDYTGADYNSALQSVNAYEQANNLNSASNAWQVDTPPPATQPSVPSYVSDYNYSAPSVSADAALAQLGTYLDQGNYNSAYALANQWNVADQLDSYWQGYNPTTYEAYNNPQPNSWTAPYTAYGLAEGVADTRDYQRAGDVVYGRYAIDTSMPNYYFGNDGPQSVNTISYLDPYGNKLTTGAFNPENILEMSEKFGIPLSDLVGLADQLDAAGINYGPYMLYSGTGSDHGIDLRDLASGGYGTAYNWADDPMVASKGASGATSLSDAQALAERFGLTRNPGVTSETGLNWINPTNLQTLQNGAGETVNYFVTNGATSAGFPSLEAAYAYMQSNGGQLVVTDPNNTPWSRQVQPNTGGQAPSGTGGYTAGEGVLPGEQWTYERPGFTYVPETGGFVSNRDTGSSGSYADTGDPNKQGAWVPSVYANGGAVDYSGIIQPGDAGYAIAGQTGGPNTGSYNPGAGGSYNPGAGGSYNPGAGGVGGSYNPATGTPTGGYWQGAAAPVPANMSAGKYVPGSDFERELLNSYNNLQTSVSNAYNQWKPQIQQYQAVSRELNPETDTVQGQLNALLAEDSPYINRAKLAAAEQANARGLLNASLAAQSGQAAAIDAGLQIAAPDAAAYLQQGLTNQQYLNQAAQYNADVYNQLATAGFNSTLQGALTAQQQTGQGSLMTLDDSIKQSQMRLDDSLTRGRMELDASLRDFLDANASRRDSAIEAGKQVAGITAQYLDSYAQIMQADMSAEDKDNQIHNLELGLQQMINATLGTFEGYEAFGAQISDSFRATINAGDSIAKRIGEAIIGTVPDGVDPTTGSAAVSGEPSTWGPPADGDSGSRYYDGEEYVYQYGVWRPRIDTSHNY